MKPFHFRLQRVLDVKKVIEQQRERELAEAFGTLVREQQKLEGIREELSVTQHTESTRGGRTVFELLLYDHFITQKLSDIERQAGTIHKVDKLVHTRRKRLETAFKDREILDRLRKRSTKEYRREMNKEDQALIDEIASAQHTGDTSLKLAGREDF